ncbi:hypothetical protein CPB86DRAFT_329585 [Serendipita vermifera]|nr:hypothetical protein CPB86DRAFT_329585 [Serendipita vermifera]
MSQGLLLHTALGVPCASDIDSGLKGSLNHLANPSGALAGFLRIALHATKRSSMASGIVLRASSSWLDFVFKCSRYSFNCSAADSSLRPIVSIFLSSFGFFDF